MLSPYVGKVLEVGRAGLPWLAVFAVLYGLLYLIPSLDALLAGALLGFAALTTASA